MIQNKVCGCRQTVATGGYGEEMGFGNRENKSRLSVSTMQVQTPAVVAGGDALAWRVFPQRKMRRTLSKKKKNKSPPDESAREEMERHVWMYTMTAQNYMKADR